MDWKFTLEKDFNAMFLSEVKQIWLRQTTDDVYCPSCHFLFSDLFAMHELNQDTFIMLNDVDSDAYIGNI